MHVDEPEQANFADSSDGVNGADDMIARWAVMLLPEGSKVVGLIAIYRYVAQSSLAQGSGWSRRCFIENFKIVRSGASHESLVWWGCTPPLISRWI